MPPQSAIPELQRASTSLSVRVSPSRPAPLPGHSVITSPAESVDPALSQTSEHAAPPEFLLSDERKRPIGISSLSCLREVRRRLSLSVFRQPLHLRDTRPQDEASSDVVSSYGLPPVHCANNQPDCTSSPRCAVSIAAPHFQKIINPLAPRLTPEVINIAAHHLPTPIQSNGIVLPYSTSLDLLTHHRRGTHLPTPQLTSESNGIVLAYSTALGLLSPPSTKIQSEGFSSAPTPHRCHDWHWFLLADLNAVEYIHAHSSPIGRPKEFETSTLNERHEGYGRSVFRNNTFTKGMNGESGHPQSETGAFGLTK